MKLSATLLAAVLSLFCRGQITVTDVLPLYTGDMDMSRATDLDNDGDLDLLLLTGDQVQISINDGSLNFSTPVSIATMPVIPGNEGERDIYSLDYDLDGWNDVICMTDKHMTAFRNEGSLLFSAHNIFTYLNDDLNYQNYRMSLGDIDTDGHDNILLVLPGQVCRIDHLGSNAFSDLITVHADPTIIANAFWGGHELVVDDFNGDGVNDLVAMNGPDLDFIETGLVSGTEFDPTGLGGNGPIPMGTNVHFIEASDVDGDLDLDWIISMDWGGIVVNYNDGQGQQDYTYDTEIGLSPWPPTIEVDDVNGDGYPDILFSAYMIGDPISPFPDMGPATYAVFNDGTGDFPGLTGGPPLAQWITAEPAWEVPWVAADLDGNGVNEYLNLSLVLQNEDIETYLNGLVFYDQNQNGQWDTGENPIFAQEISFNDVLIFSGTQGQFQVPADNGTYTFTFIESPLWSLTTPATYTVTIVDGIADQNDLLFGLIPEGEVYAFASTFISSWAVCGSEGEHQVHLTNTGNMPAHGTVTLQLDDLYNFVSASPDASSVNGNTLVWEFPEIWPTATYEIEITAIKPTSDYIGQIVQHTVTVDAEDATDALVFTGNAISEVIHSCSYDPNYISVSPVGWTNEGFVLQDTPLEYTIHFQNVGNAPAEDVRIENPLPSEMNWATWQPIAWSHEISAMELDDSGALLVRFDDIMLPDSASDEPNSHGYVTYRIEMNEGLAPLTAVTNYAEIYFDLNVPVITNSTLNTIFTCDMMTYDILMEAQVCTGDAFEYDPEVQYSESYEWTIDGTPFSAEEEINFTPALPGDYTLVLTASNPLCTTDIEIPLAATSAPPTPVITQESNTLTATGSGIFYWYFNGEWLDNNTGNTLWLTESGWVYVFVVDGICSSDPSTEEFFSYNSVTEPSFGFLHVFPNPSSDAVFIEPSPDMIGKDMVLLNAMGQQVFRDSITSSPVTIDLSAFPVGLYTLCIPEDASFPSVNLMRK